MKKKLMAVAAAAAVGGGVLMMSPSQSEGVTSSSGTAAANGEMAFGSTVSPGQSEVPIPSSSVPLKDASEIPVDIPVAEIPVVTVPAVDMPAVVVPEISCTVDISEADMSKYGIDCGLPAGVSGQPVISDMSVSMPVISDPADRVPQVKSFVSDCRRLFRDQRGIHHDSTANFDNASFKQWLSIYKSDVPYELDYVEMPSGLKMVAEAHHPIDAAVLSGNLGFYRRMGCNAVLVTFGYQGEDMGVLLNLVDMIHSHGMRAYFAYSGQENFKTVFVEPDVLRSKLQSLSRVCDGFLLGWRRTSLHLFEQDRQYVNFVMRAVRDANPRIPVIGEAYYGDTASSRGNHRNLQYNVPANASGVAIVGLGYNGVAVEPVVRELLKGISGLNRMVVVTGDRPYYATAHGNGLGFAENYRIKEAIADRWVRSGVSNVVILHGDGSDGNYDRRHDDNIGSTPADVTMVK